jgi:hypothetical protein
MARTHRMHPDLRVCHTPAPQQLLVDDPIPALALVMDPSRSTPSARAVATEAGLAPADVTGRVRIVNAPEDELALSQLGTEDRACVHPLCAARLWRLRADGVRARRRVDGEHTEDSDRGIRRRGVFFSDD